MADMVDQDTDSAETMPTAILSLDEEDRTFFELSSKSVHKLDQDQSDSQ